MNTLLQAMNLIKSISKLNIEGKAILEKHSALLQDDFNNVCLELAVKICAFVDENIPQISQEYGKRYKKPLNPEFLSSIFCFPKKTTDIYRKKNNIDVGNEIRKAVSEKLEDLIIPNDTFFGRDIVARKQQIKEKKHIKALKTFKENNRNFALEPEYEKVSLHDFINDVCPHLVIIPDEDEKGFLAMYNFNIFDIKATMLKKQTESLTQSWYEMFQPLLITTEKLFARPKGWQLPQNLDKGHFNITWACQSFYSLIPKLHYYEHLKHTNLCCRLNFQEWCKDTIIVQLYVFDRKSNNLTSIQASRNDILRIKRNIIGYIHKDGNKNKEVLGIWNKLKPLIKKNYISEHIINLNILAIADEIEYSWNNFIQNKLIIL